MRYLVLVALLTGVFGIAQDHFRFRDEVLAIGKKYDSLWDQNKETIVFTGSSSIRIWEELPQLFPGYQVVNSGFGGSEASDLLAYADDLILRYHPKQVFIYEGDNDLALSRKPGKVVSVLKEIIRKVKDQDQGTQIVLISAKPSLARWHLKRRFTRLNRKYMRLCRKDSTLEFANIWDVMLDPDKQLRQDIFTDDGLHMNPRGYALWYDVINAYIN